MQISVFFLAGCSRGHGEEAGQTGLPPAVDHSRLETASVSSQRAVLDMCWVLYVGDGCGGALALLYLVPTVCPQLTCAPLLNNSGPVWISLYVQ